MSGHRDLGDVNCCTVALLRRLTVLKCFLRFGARAAKETFTKDSGIVSTQCHPPSIWDPHSSFTASISSAGSIARWGVGGTSVPDVNCGPGKESH